MNLNALFTASIDNYIPGMKGATLANYVEFIDFIKDENSGKIIGAKLLDSISGQSFEIKAKVIVNCAGIFSDKIRKLDNPEVKEVI